MVALVATIHVFARASRRAFGDQLCRPSLLSGMPLASQDVDGRDKPDHDVAEAERYAAFLPSEAFASANAYAIHGSSALRSRLCTVAPHQMRRPGGASR